MNLDQSLQSNLIEDRRGWSLLHALISAYTPSPPDWDLYKRSFQHPFTPMGDTNQYYPSNQLQNDAGLGSIPAVSQGATFAAPIPFTANAIGQAQGWSPYFAAPAQTLPAGARPIFSGGLTP